MTNTQCICFDPESLEAKLDNISEELALAFRWNRPSILFAIYANNSLRKLAQKKLAALLVKEGYDQVLYQVEYDVTDEFPRLIKQLSGTHSIISIDPMNSNTTISQVNRLIEILDVNKGLAIDSAAKMVIWLTQEESVLFAHLAPDLWSSRHRVIELEDASAQPEAILPMANVAAELETDQEGYLDLDCDISLVDPAVAQHINSAIVAWQRKDQNGIADALAKACQLSQASSSIATKLTCLKAKKFFANQRGAYAEETEIDARIAGLQQKGSALFAAIQPQVSSTSSSPIATLEAEATANPSDPSVIERLAKGYEINGELAKAIAQYRKLVKIVGTDADEQRIWATLGRLYNQTNGVEESIAAFAISTAYIGTQQSNATRIDVSKLSADMWIEIGNLLLRSQDMKQAEAAYLQALGIDPNAASAYSNLGILYTMMGLNDQALVNIQKGASMFVGADQKKAALNLLGDHLRISGNYGEAIKAYQAADDLSATDATEKNFLFTNNLFSSFVDARKK